MVGFRGTMMEIFDVLKGVQEGTISIEEAYLELKKTPFEDVGYAKVDTHRKLRQGAAEVIYGAGKTPEQMIGIIEAMKQRGQENILITRLSEDAATKMQKAVSFQYYPEARIGIVGQIQRKRQGKVIVATGGTSDIPVAEEAALTAEFHGSEVIRLYDVGVAGLHRLLAHLDELMSASVVIAVAGMEGALASVIGGLVDVPVIAVPTSIGYGASFGGVAALLSMLNSCASGVSVVNIDNGFGAGYLANMMNQKGV